MPDIVDDVGHYLFWMLDGFESVSVAFDDHPDGLRGEIFDRDDSLQNRLYGLEEWLARFSERPSSFALDD